MSAHLRCDSTTVPSVEAGDDAVVVVPMESWSIEELGAMQSRARNISRASDVARLRIPRKLLWPTDRRLSRAVEAQ